MTTQLTNTSGWGALINGIVGVFGVVFLIIFFTAGEPFGTLNDLTSLPWALALVPVLFLFYRLGSHGSKTWSMIGLAAGLVGLAGVFVLQLLLILKVITIWQQTYFITASYGAIGVWIIIASRIGRGEGLISPALSILGIALGIGWILANVGIWLGGIPAGANAGAMSDMSQVSIFTIISFGLIFLGYFAQPIWAIWLGRILLRK